ncbi:protein-export chaperone SecB [Companilactobacillus zhongbaensis]|uniref:protein-export chaperone SecB n=1 Tax=Companilactobacillus zhongbaensis TaxID=2486009 RepID=UPI000F78C259|nr:protein-export chaperone SecB [Companilactobacillus zhongbaensis]
MTVLEFKGYTVNEMNYKKNPNYIPGSSKKISLNPTFSSDNDISDNEIHVNLDIKVGSLKETSIPFEASCSVQGLFEYNPNEDEDDIGIDTFLRNNALAILYPYARAIIATLTTSSNEFPGYNLPTVNITKALESNNDNS